MTIYTLGPAGTFSHEATLEIFPQNEVLFAPNFDRLFDMLSQKKEAIGVVPVENSLHGSIDEILDLLRETDIKIWRMHEVRIRHAFGCKDPTLITKIASHPQALRQSRLWLKQIKRQESSLRRN
jgi:prephenate dehydratase